MPIMIGAVKPWTMAAYQEINGRFHCTSVFGNPSTGFPDHLAGLALDFMVFQDRAKGDAIAEYAIANYQRLDIGYVIWWQRIWYPNSGWHQMADRGSVNLNHKNHVHVDFRATPPSKSGPVVVPAGFGNANPAGVSIPGVDQITSLANAIGWITDTHNLGRIGIFALGVTLMVIGFSGLEKSTQVVKGMSA